jgi:mycothiol system anti-sigma-R factor
MPTPRHYHEEVQDWLDGRLDAAQCDEVERHLESCDECRRAYESVGWVKQTAARHFAATPAPAELRARVLAALRAEANAPVETEEPATKIIQPPVIFWRSRRAVLAAAVFVLAALLAGIVLLRPASLPLVVAQDFQNYQSGKVPLQLVTTDVKEMEKFFTAQGVPFETRVFDLGMMNYRLAGGRVLAPGRSPRAAFAYQGANNQKLLCQMFAGQVTELPSGAVRRENKGFTFHIYERDGLTAVFWQEGTVVCVLVSDIAPEEVVQLAFAKAMPPG